MSSVILNTPNAIYKVVRNYLPEATFSIVQTDPILCEIDDSHFQDPISLTHAVNKVAFSKFLQSVKSGDQISLLGSQSFSTDSPLSNWQKFRRIQYEINGNTCAQAIINYVRSQSDDDLQVVESLGLAPSQLQASCTEYDRAYLQQVLDQVQEDFAVQEFFKELYPQTFQIAVFHSNPNSTAKWPNLQTVFTAITVLNSVAYLASPNPYFLVSQVSIRALSIFVSLYINKKTKIGFDAFGLVCSLTGSYGSAVAIVGDLVFEGINLNRNSNLAKKMDQFFMSKFNSNSSHGISLSNRLDPSIPENACKILNLSPDDQANKEKIDQQYHVLLELLVKRRDRVTASFRPTIQQLIDDLDEAYKTLTGSYPNPHED